MLASFTEPTTKQDQFLQAYDKHADAIYRYCYFRVYQKQLAEDLVQDTFMRVWQYLAKGHQVDSMKAFLYTTARNLIIDTKRKSKPQISIEESEEHGSFLVDKDAQMIYDHLDAQIIYDVLHALTSEDQELIILRYIEGYKPKEIAVLLGETPNVISVRLHRAKKEFKTVCRPTV